MYLDFRFTHSAQMPAISPVYGMPFFINIIIPSFRNELWINFTNNDFIMIWILGAKTTKPSKSVYIQKQKLKLIYLIV